MSDWQPIETAPKDGTHILVLRDLNDDSFDHLVVWWTGAEDYPWRGDFNAYPESRLAYWQPLPAPPADPVRAVEDKRETVPVGDPGPYVGGLRSIWEVITDNINKLVGHKSWSGTRWLTCDPDGWIDWQGGEQLVGMR